MTDAAAVAYIVRWNEEETSNWEFTHPHLRTGESERGIRLLGGYCSPF